jgi:lipoic acid synthetase
VSLRRLALVEAEREHPRRRLPTWLKVPAPGNARYVELKKLVRKGALHTVCEEARCPNIGECWGHHGTATFMILGDVCTRSCGFCAVRTGKPPVYDEDEPRRVAEAISGLGLRHAVITSVNRDELPDGGAKIFAETIRLTRLSSPGTSIEVLIPDFKGNRAALETVLEQKPDILNHNVETIPRLYRRVRPQADYRRSLAVLAWSKGRGAKTKTGIMVGLGEQSEEIVEVMRDLVEIGCDIMTIGQYLRPTPAHLPVERFYHPDEFEELKRLGESLGIAHVESGPLVRSSYHAASQVDELHSRSRTPFRAR